MIKISSQNKLLTYLTIFLFTIIGVSAECSYPAIGDWTLTSNQTCINKTFSIQGNLNVGSTYNLTLINTSLYININNSNRYVNVTDEGSITLDQDSYLGPGPWVKIKDLLDDGFIVISLFVVGFGIVYRRRKKKKFLEEEDYGGFEASA